MCRLAVLQINKANHPQPPTSLGPPSSNHPPDHLLLIRHLLFPPLSCLPQEQTSICLTTIRTRWIRRFLLSRINIVYIHIYIYIRTQCVRLRVSTPGSPPSKGMFGRDGCRRRGQWMERSNIGGGRYHFWPTIRYPARFPSSFLFFDTCSISTRQAESTGY